MIGSKTSTVRLLLSWSRVEPAPGVYDDSYLDEVRAAAGRLRQASYNFASGTFAASGSDPTGGTLFVAFYPSGRDGMRTPQATGLDAVQVLPAAGGHSYIVARGTGGEWSITLP